MGQATPMRSLAKTLTWRIIATADTFILTFLSATYLAADLGITSDQATGLAATVAALELVTKLALYYLHERGWARLNWGTNAQAHAN